MEEKREYKVSEVIEFTLNILRSIRPPMDLFREISVPIHQAISNLEQCIAASEAEQAPAIEAAKDEPEEEKADGNADPE